MDSSMLRPQRTLRVGYDALQVVASYSHLYSREDILAARLVGPAWRLAFGTAITSVTFHTNADVAAAAKHKQHAFPNLKSFSIMRAFSFGYDSDKVDLRPLAGLGFTHATISDPCRFPSLAPLAPSLTRLEVESGFFSVEEEEEVAVVLASLTSLQHLKLKTDDEQFEVLCAGLPALTRLTHLHLSTAHDPSHSVLLAASSLPRLTSLCVVSAAREVDDVRGLMDQHFPGSIHCSVLVHDSDGSWEGKADLTTLVREASEWRIMEHVHTAIQTGPSEIYRVGPKILSELPFSKLTDVSRLALTMRLDVLEAPGAAIDLRAFPGLRVLSLNLLYLHSFHQLHPDQEQRTQPLPTLLTSRPCVNLSEIKFVSSTSYVDTTSAARSLAMSPLAFLQSVPLFAPNLVNLQLWGFPVDELESALPQLTCLTQLSLSCGVRFQTSHMMMKGASFSDFKCMARHEQTWLQGGALPPSLKVLMLAFVRLVGEATQLTALTSLELYHVTDCNVFHAFSESTLLEALAIKHNSQPLDLTKFASFSCLADLDLSFAVLEPPTADASPRWSAIKALTSLSRLHTLALPFWDGITQQNDQDPALSVEDVFMDFRTLSELSICMKVSPAPLPNLDDMHLCRFARLGHLRRFTLTLQSDNTPVDWEYEMEDSDVCELEMALAGLMPHTFVKVGLTFYFEGDM